MAKQTTNQRVDALTARMATELDATNQRQPRMSVADLLAYNGDMPVMEIAGRGWFQRDKASTATVDGVTVHEAFGGGRWLLTLDRELSAVLFGVVGDGKADDTAALQKIATFSAATVVTIIFPLAMTCRITGTIIKPESFNGLNWKTTGGAVTFVYPQLANFDACIKIVGGSGRMCNAELTGFIFKGNDFSTAVEIAGQNGQTVKRCTFQTNLVAVCFHNDKAGQFTEWNTIEYCSIEQECACSVHYKRSAGDLSFHGSGMAGINWINTKGKNGLPCILIDENCLPYNAPMHVQIWTHGDVTVFDNHNTAPAFYTPTFNGCVTVERFAGETKLGGHWRSLFSGAVQVFGDHVTAGSLLQCSKVIYKDGSALAMGVRWSGRQPLATGSTTIETFATGATFQIMARLIGPEYDYRYLLLIDHEGNGHNGFVAQVTAIREFNRATWGAPSFTVDTAGRLVISNPNYPAVGVTAEVTYTQVGDFYAGNSPQSIF